MRVKFLAAVAFAVAVAAVVVPAASAAPTECNGTFSNTTLKGGVVVNSGDHCDLENVTVKGGLIVNGSTDFAYLAVNNSTIKGGWSITGLLAATGSNNGYFCGNSVDGGLTVDNVLVANSDVSFYGPLSFGELNAGCAGGRVNGGVSFTNILSLGTELDGYLVNGGVTFANVFALGINEIEATTVHGSGSCDAASNVINDNSGPGNNANSYTGTSGGCPA